MIRFNPGLCGGLLLACLLGGLSGAGMVWWWLGSPLTASESGAPPASQSTARKVLYYRNPMGEADTSPGPKKDAMGMDYIPVYADEASPPAKPLTVSTVPPARKVLYYRNPMGEADVSPVPKKDAMGMDYLPVYADQGEPGSVSLTPERIQLLGVQRAPVAAVALHREIRAVGRMAVDERRQVTVSAKYGGWIEKLPVNTTGQAVRAGQTLLEAYSPELVAAQQEYLVARATQDRLPADGADTGGPRLSWSEGGLQRLRFLDVPEPVLRELATASRVRRTLPLLAPAGGVVLTRNVQLGQRFEAGQALYEIADLSHLWLLVDVFEQDLQAIQPGQAVDIRVNALPGEVFTGRITFIYPTLNASTRTVPVRIELENPGGRLKPAMYAEATLAVPLPAQALSVPESALIDTGTRQVVLLARDQGRFMPRQVVAGASGVTVSGERRVIIREGLLPDEQVVTRANFLLDSESNLRAAFSALTAGATTTSAPAALASPVAAPPAASSSASPGMAMPVSAAAGTQGAAGETLPASSAPVAWPVTATHNTAQHGG